jgi:hypothetical protein
MVEDLIRRARRRFILNETLGQLAFAAAVIAGGFALLLIVGTRYMEWWTLALFAAIGLGIGTYRVWLRTPDPYTTAVRLDQNAGLRDALSTALHFAGHTAPSAEFQRGQREQADAAAGTVHLEQAAPFVFPRSVYAMAALCLLASGLIMLRYGLGHGLDLHAPITQFLLEDQAIHEANKKALPFPKSQKPWMDEAQSLLSKMAGAQTPDTPAPGDPDALDKAIEQALQSPRDPDGKGEKGAGSDKAGASKEGAASDQQKTGDPIDNSEQANSDQNGSQSPDSKAGEQGSKQSSGKNASGGSKQGLLSRLKDAVSNMFSKSDQDQNAAPQDNQQSAKNDSPQGSKQQSKGDQQKGNSQADAQAGQPDANGQNGQQSQGKMSSTGDKQPGQGGSGIGSQDGSKEIREAAQLKAMGKISEIIGQRAATVSGETTVEVQSGNQKLHTDYSNTKAAHAETDGDVTRDEIPVGVQSYVQQYFAEVRKSDGAGKQKKSGKGPEPNAAQ